jgi:hypothetical protein
VLLIAYGLLWGIGRAQQPLAVRLATLEPYASELDPYLEAAIPVTKSPEERADSLLRVAVQSLHQARRTTLGLFPRYDTVRVGQALSALLEHETVLQEQEELLPGIAPDSATLNTRALSYLLTAKAYLMRNDAASARLWLQAASRLETRYREEALRLQQQLYGSVPAVPSAPAPATPPAETPAPGTQPESLSTASRPTPAVVAGTPAPKRYVLIVGIDDYPGTYRLTSSVTDANLVRDLLINDYGIPEQHVLVLRDRDASRERIQNAITQHLGQAGPNDYVGLYFSGHGFQLPGNMQYNGSLDPETDGRDEALYVWGETPGKSNYILDDELGAMLDRLQARRILVILDACHSGTAIRGDAANPLTKEVQYQQIEAYLERPATFAQASPPPSAYQSEMSELSRHLYLSAATDQEKALAGENGNPSLFTRYLLEALRQARTAPSEQTFEALMESVAHRTNQYARNNYRMSQHPQVHGSQRTEAVVPFLGGGN